MLDGKRPVGQHQIIRGIALNVIESDEEIIDGNYGF